MEGPASILCRRTCYIKDSKPLHLPKTPLELGQAHLPRDCGRSRRMMKPRRSNSISMCTLPIIPEYPGFQDIKRSRNCMETPAFSRLFQDLERGRSSSAQLNNFPNRASLVHCLGGSSRGYWKGHSTTSSGFRDKPLQEYFNERLMELRNYESKRSNRKTKAFADKNQSTCLTCTSSGRRGSGGAVVRTGPGTGGEESCSSACHRSQNGTEQEETQNVLSLCKGDFLDILTRHITLPLEAFVQKN